MLERLTEQLCAGLEEHGRRGRTIGIKVRLDDFSTHTRARTLPAPTDGCSEVLAVARELLATLDPARPVRLLGVRVAMLEASGPSPALARDGGTAQLRLGV